MIRIIGLGMTPQGRVQLGPAELAKRALVEALVDAELEIGQLGLIVVANAGGGVLSDQEMIRGQSWLRDLGLRGSPVVNVDNACAGGATAMHLGCLAVEGGVSPVLVLGVEKMWGDREAAARAIEQGMPADTRLEQHMRVPPDAPSTPMGLNAMWAQELLDRGTTREHFALAAARSFRHGSLNPLAQQRSPLSPQEILDSRVVAWPLTRHMCSSFTDGAAAAVLSSAPAAGAPYVKASAMRSGDGSLEYHQRLLEGAELAWKMAGVGPADMDVVELHDVTSSEELFALETLGFCEPGEAGPAVAAGKLAVGSEGLVVNPSGGLMARGHALGATGLCQVVELVEQLRGSAGARQVFKPRIGMTINTGGLIGLDTAAVGCHILSI